MVLTPHSLPCALELMESSAWRSSLKPIEVWRIEKIMAYWILHAKLALSPYYGSCFAKFSRESGTVDLLWAQRDSCQPAAGYFRDEAFEQLHPWLPGLHFASEALSEMGALFVKHPEKPQQASLRLLLEESTWSRVWHANLARDDERRLDLAWPRAPSQKKDRF